MWPGRFIAGNSIQHVLPVAKRVLDNTKWPIINYAIEHTSLPEGVFHEHMQLIKHLDYHYKIAIKVSSFGFDEDLIDTSKQDISESTARVAADLSEQKNHSAQSIERLRERLERTIESLNVDLELSETNLNFRVDKVSDRVLVAVINEDTGETVRQVPAEAILKVAHNIEALKGILFDDVF